jgi:tetratricopeptide (TPR) repeat protein
MFQEAVQAIHQGQRARARDLLTRLLRADQRNAAYWLWMSSVVTTPKEQVYCLQSALRLDPGNQSARRGLTTLGALPPNASLKPVPPPRRQWVVEVQEVHEVSGVRRLLGNPVVRVMLISFAALALIGVVGFFFIRWASTPERNTAVIFPTSTPGPPPTLTFTPTPINYTPTPPTATPTFEGGIPPLWLRLEATFTSTPTYVATMHITNEAFNNALRLYREGDLETALERMQQAAQFEPQAPDIQYFLGEIQLALDDPQKALAAYQQAIDIDPSFAPAYLGRAIARGKIDPDADVLEDLDKAIELAPDLKQAYLERVAYYMATGDFDAAREELEVLERSYPDTAQLALYRAQIHLAEGEYEEALEMAEKANRLDPSLLPTYLALGQAALLNEDYETAAEALDVYMLYEQGDPQALLLYGQTLYATGQYSETLTTMESALELDKGLADAYYYRGLVYLEQDEGQLAINEIVLARNLDRTSFAYSLALGRALLSANRLAEARDQLTAAGRLAESDEELAQVYYYRALAIEAIGNQPAADRDWQALLGLPEEAVPGAWLRAARARLATPTPTRTPTRTPTATRTPNPAQ